MKISVLFFLFITLLSCKKELVNRGFLPNVPVGKLYPPNINFNDNSLNFCNSPIAWWGDSMTEAWNEYGNAYSPLYFLGQMMKIDTMSYHTDGTGWHYNNGSGNDRLFMGGISGQTSIQIRDRFINDTIHNKWATVIWVGQNNVGNPDVVLANIDQIVKMVYKNKFIVIGVITGNWPGREKGTEYYSIVHDYINATLSRRYGSHYIDPLTILIANASKSKEDSTCVAHNVTPASLTVDGLHLNLRGSYLQALSVFQKLRTCN